MRRRRGRSEVLNDGVKRYERGVILVLPHPLYPRETVLAHGRSVNAGSQRKRAGGASSEAVLRGIALKEDRKARQEVQGGWR